MIELLTMKISLLAAITLVVLADSHAVQGTPIQINLGAPGTYSTDMTIPFSGLNGTALAGQSLSVDFVFTNSEFLRLFTVTTSFSTLITLQTNGSGLVGFLHGTGYLTDSLGNALELPEILGSASSDDGQMFAGLFPQVGRPIDIYGAHFDLTLPTNLKLGVTEGQLRLLSDGFAFGIGPGLPADIVPETGSTAILLGMSFLAIILFAHRLHRNKRRYCHAHRRNRLGNQDNRQKLDASIPVTKNGKFSCAHGLVTQTRSASSDLTCAVHDLLVIQYTMRCCSRWAKDQ